MACIQALALAFVLAAPSAAAQSRERPVTVTPSAITDGAALASGWQALANGQFDAAIQVATTILSRTPWQHAALVLRIEALAQKDPVQALDAYETWLGRRRTEDAGLLAPVPRAILVELAAAPAADVRAAARRALNESGIFVSGDAADPIDQLYESAIRTQAGDAAALKRLEGLVSTNAFDSELVAHAIEEAGDAATPLLIGMLESPAAPMRASAAKALGRGKVSQSRPALVKRLQDPDPVVRSAVAVALARMGDPAGQAVVDRMIQSEVPDLRLAAAEAWEGKPGPWTAAVRPLLESRDGTTRLHAARLLASVDPAASARVLGEGMADGNPAVRAEAARLAQEVAGQVSDAESIARARRLLRERDALVRVYAAGLLLTAARTER